MAAIQEIAWDGYLFTQPDSTFYYAQIQYNYAKEKGLKKYMALALNIQGASFASRGDFIEAIDYYSRSLKIREEINDKKGVAVCLSNIGIIYKNQGDIPKALIYYHKSLKIQEELNNNHGIAASLTNIGIIYKAQGDYPKALEYYTKSLKLREKDDDQRGIGYELNNIGILHTKQNDFNKAFNNYNQALAIQNKIGDKKGQSLSLVNIGSAYHDLGKLDSAIEYFSKALIIRKSIGDKKGITRVLGSLGITYSTKGNHAKAINFANQSLLMAKELGLANETKDAANTLYKSYKAIGNKDKALTNYELYIIMKDSLVNDEIKNELLKQQYQIKADSIRVEQEKKDVLAKAEQQRRDDIAKKESEKKNLIITAGVIGTILGLFFTILIFNRLRITRKQKAIIEEQKLIVEEKNTEILDSITYAKRIQTAILPPSKLVKEHLKDSFILYKPKDIVAGDFYWLECKDGKVLFAAADCTGHGVPGAMVSVICNNGLNRSVREYGLTDPGKILDKTREIVTSEFNKSDEDVKDGMDIALCVIDDLNLKYAGAHNPLWIIRKGATEIEETKADKQPIGKYANTTQFRTNDISINKGDTIYIFSDGYVDQFGGEKEKKFKSKAFKQLLLSIQDKTMEEQKLIIDNVFEKWRGNIEQIDDVCIIGVRI